VFIPPRLDSCSSSREGFLEVKKEEENGRVVERETGLKWAEHDVLRHEIEAQLSRQRAIERL